MSEKIKKSFRERYDRLKKVVKKILKPGNDKTPQLILQPIRNNNRISF